MTDTDKTIPVWVDNDGEKVQVGWATPDNGGVRKINLLDEYSNTALKDVKFGDIDPFETTLDPDETQEPPRTFEEFVSEPFTDIDGAVIEPAIDESPSGVEVVNYEPEVLPSEPIEDAPDEDLAAEPIDAGVAPEDSEPVVEDDLLDDDDTYLDEDSDDTEFAEEVTDEPAGAEDATGYDDHQDH